MNHHPDSHHETPHNPPPHRVDDDPHADHTRRQAHGAVLDLDAELIHDHVRALLVGLPLAAAPTQVLDLGAGTGAGTLALLRAFPSAHVTAVDQSVEHLDLLRARCAFEGLADRVTGIAADLDDTTWPDLGTPDLVWASASLHHLSDPVQTLRHVRRLMAPGGLLVVVELDGMPRFLPSDAADGAGALEQHCYDVLQATMTEHMPHRGADWSVLLTEAGFGVTSSRTIALATPSAEHPAVRPYAAAALRRLQTAAAPHLTRTENALFDRLLDPNDPGSIAQRSDLTATASRGVWLAGPNDSPNHTFSAETEAAICERVLGRRRHGLENLRRARP